MPNTPPKAVTIDTLIVRYDALLLDAYGVLVDRSGPLPGAVALINRLNVLGKPYFVLTNSASRLPGTLADAFAAMGLAIPPDRCITSGGVLQTVLRDRGLAGKRCVVLGPRDARRYAQAAGATLCDPDRDEDAEVVVLADQQGYPFLEVLDATLSLILRRLDAGQPIHLLLCNPDLLYPVAPGQYGFTSGGVAAMFEAVLNERYPGAGHAFIRLGKPFPPLFEEAVRRSGSRNIVMVGDQLATDILGAARFGIDSALVTSGLARADTVNADGLCPTYRLPSLVG